MRCGRIPAYVDTIFYPEVIPPAAALGEGDLMFFYVSCNPRKMNAIGYEGLLNIQRSKYSSELTYINRSLW